MKRLALAALAAVFFAGCSERSNRLDLGVDLYLQPQSGTAEDLILQAAIRKKMLDAVPRNDGIVYVRVVEKVVYLSGSVKTEQLKTRAFEAASKIDIQLDGQPLKPEAIKADSLTAGL
jgi:osmotically-inducible protein OsmY